ncbi:dihydroxyacetone kinase subunit DhaK [Candidatus Poribacteria bacterium]|nr:dihydroxyacetone kinase subunit DhaK [Candidatus Poribacteria bacterium]
MKKILNDPFDYVDEMLAGLCLAHPEYYRQLGSDGKVIARPEAPIKGKVGLVCGGGSGHLPVFTGYVGKGLLDACAIAGMVYAFKMAGAKAEEMADLEAVASIAQKAVDACRSIGVALTPCTVPAAGRPTFEIGEDEMEIGMGIHGEPGVRRGPLKSADDIAEEMLAIILADMPLASGTRVSVLCNSLGATPPEELYIVYRYVARSLAKLGVEIVMPLVGRYATSMEMMGMSITVCRLDDELEKLLKAPCDCAFWRV